MDKCPRCSAELDWDEVDIGVGTLRGNYGCPECHWTPPDDEKLFKIPLVDGSEH